MFSPVGLCLRRLFVLEPGPKPSWDTNTTSRPLSTTISNSNLFDSSYNSRRNRRPSPLNSFSTNFELPSLSSPSPVAATTEKKESYKEISRRLDCKFKRDSYCSFDHIHFCIITMWCFVLLFVLQAKLSIYVICYMIQQALQYRYVRMAQYPATISIITRVGPTHTPHACHHPPYHLPSPTCHHQSIYLNIV